MQQVRMKFDPLRCNFCTECGIVMDSHRIINLKDGSLHSFLEYDGTSLTRYIACCDDEAVNDMVAIHDDTIPCSAKVAVKKKNVLYASFIM